MTCAQYKEWGKENRTHGVGMIKGRFAPPSSGLPYEHHDGAQRMSDAEERTLEHAHASVIYLCHCA